MDDFYDEMRDTLQYVNLLPITPEFTVQFADLESSCINNQRICMVVKKFGSQSKEIIIFTTLGLSLLLSPPTAHAIGLNKLPPAPIIRLDTRNANVGPRQSVIHGRKQDKMGSLRNRELFPFVYLLDEGFLKTKTKLIKELRGGSGLIFLLNYTIFVVVLYSMCRITNPENFLTPEESYHWRQNSPTYFHPPMEPESQLEITWFTGMPHQDFTPINTFESDVLGISPIDKDNP